MADDNTQPIIIKKKKGGHGGHHGGAWKVAFADFMTAMMAFFLVMWIVGQDQSVREAVGAPGAYTSAGIDLAVPLLFERSRLRRAPHIEVTIDGEISVFGGGARRGRLVTDVETFVRLTGGRNPHPTRYRLEGAGPSDVVLFS